MFNFLPPLFHHGPTPLTAADFDFLSSMLKLYILQMA